MRLVSVLEGQSKALRHRPVLTLPHHRVHALPVPIKTIPLAKLHFEVAFFAEPLRPQGHPFFQGSSSHLAFFELRARHSSRRVSRSAQPLVEGNMPRLEAARLPNLRLTLQKRRFFACPPFRALLHPQECSPLVQAPHAPAKVRRQMLGLHVRVQPTKNGIFIWSPEPALMLLSAHYSLSTVLSIR